MKTTYETTVLGWGNHAALEIPESNLAELGTTKRAPLVVAINGHSYQSTATTMDGQCLVVFPMRDREAAGVQIGDTVAVTLTLDAGYREVAIPAELAAALKEHELFGTFHNRSYSERHEFAHSIEEAKTSNTKDRRIAKIIEILQNK